MDSSFVFKPTLVQVWGSLHAQSFCAGHTNYNCTNNFTRFTLKTGGKFSSPYLPGVGWGGQSFRVQAACAAQDTILQA